MSIQPPSTFVNITKELLESTQDSDQPVASGSSHLHVTSAALIWKAIKKGDLEQVISLLEAVPSEQNLNNNSASEQPITSEKRAAKSTSLFFTEEGDVPSANEEQGEDSEISEQLYPSSHLVSMPLNKYGWTALHEACYFGHIDIVSYLIEQHQADINQISSGGRHSLIFAVYGGHIDVVDYLLYETNVNTELRDVRSGRTASEIAEHLNDREMQDLFAEWMEFNREGGSCHSGGSHSSSFSAMSQLLLQSLEDI